MSFRIECLQQDQCEKIQISNKRIVYKRPVGATLARTLAANRFVEVTEIFSDVAKDGDLDVVEWLVICKGPYANHFNVVNRLIIMPDTDRVGHTKVVFSIGIVFTKSTWLKLAIESLTFATATKSGETIRNVIETFVKKSSEDYHHTMALASSYEPNSPERVFLDSLALHIESVRGKFHQKLDPLSIVPGYVDDEQAPSALPRDMHSATSDPVMVPTALQDPCAPSISIALSSAAEVTGPNTSSHIKIFPPYWPYAILALLIRIWLLAEHQSRQVVNNSINSSICCMSDHMAAASLPRVA